MQALSIPWIARFHTGAYYHQASPHACTPRVSRLRPSSLFHKMEGYLDDNPDRLAPLQIQSIPGDLKKLLGFIYSFYAMSTRIDSACVPHLL